MSSSSNSLPLTDSTDLSGSLWSRDTLNYKASRRTAIESSTSFDYLNFDNLFAGEKIVNNFDTNSEVLIKSDNSLPKKKRQLFKLKFKTKPQHFFNSTRNYLKNLSKHSDILTDSAKIPAAQDPVLWTENETGQLVNDEISIFNLKFQTSLLDSTGPTSILRALLFDQSQHDQLFSQFVSYSMTSYDKEASDDEPNQNASFSSTIIHNIGSNNESSSVTKLSDEEIRPENQSQNQTFLVHSDESEDEIRNFKFK
jgi:hypothetical protein